MSENNVKTAEISVESAIAELNTALATAADTCKAGNRAQSTATNDALKAVAGALLGGIGAFHKDPRKLTAYVVTALKAVKKADSVKRFYRVIKDYIEHESGIQADDYGYTMQDTGALAKAQESVKTTSILFYVSEETQKERDDKLEEKKLAKQAYIDAGAKERVMQFLEKGLQEAKARKDKEDKKPEKTRNGKEVDKAAEEAKYFEQLIEFLGK